MRVLETFNFNPSRQFKSTPYSDIALPKLVTDPLYTSSQAGLNELGSGLIKGDIPDYYKAIGDFNSPQFQAMLNSVKGQIMQGSQEASAVQGTGRSGVATTASNNALNQVLPQLTYEDYKRAIAGRGALLDEGVNVQSGVRQAAQGQQQFETNFNQQLYENQMKQAGAIDSWKKDAANSTGAMIGNIVGGVASVGLAPFTGGASLLALPGFASSAFGGSGGGDNGLSSLFSSLGKINLGGKTASFGISDPSLGSFDSLSNSPSPEIEEWFL